MGVLVRLLLLGAPIAEIVVMVTVADAIGAGPTLLLLAAGLVGGALLLRRRGLALLRRARAAVERGETPLPEIFDSICIAIAGVLLMVPGFLSDLVALPLLVPAVRQRLRSSLVQRFGLHRAGPATIEAEYREIPDGAPRLGDR